MRNRYSWMLLVLALSVSVFFVGKHYYTKAYAQKAIDVFVMKQGVPSKDIYEEKICMGLAEKWELCEKFQSTRGFGGYCISVSFY